MKSENILFDWENKTYSANARRLRETGRASLPDGRYLIVTGWTERDPPDPMGFKVLVPTECAFAVECL